MNLLLYYINSVYRTDNTFFNIRLTNERLKLAILINTVYVQKKIKDNLLLEQVRGKFKIKFIGSIPITCKWQNFF